MSARKLRQGEVVLTYLDGEEVREELVARAGSPDHGESIVSLIGKVSKLAGRENFPALADSIGTALVEAFETASEPLSDRITKSESDVLAGYPNATEQETAAAVRRSVQSWARMLERSVTTQQAGEILGVNASRIRQRLEEGTLWGFKHDGQWRVPEWQFARGELVPGISRVSQAFRQDIDPLVVEGFFTTPSTDLRVDDAMANPLEWLEARQDPEPVALIAASL